MNESNREADLTTAPEWNELGHALLKAGSYNEAINAYTRAIEMANEFKWPYIKNLAQAHYQIGRLRGQTAVNQGNDPDLWDAEEEQEVIKDYEDSLDLPSAQRYDDGLTDAPQQTGAMASAAQADPTAAWSGAQNAEDWNEMGNSYLRKRMFNEAINAYKTAITLDPRNGKPYSNLGSLYQQLGDHKIAIQLFKKSIELLDDPEDRATCWYRLGNAYRRIHEGALAKEAYRKATEIAPVANSLLARTRISMLDNVASG